MRELPKLRESVARGDLSWTKAREVSGVATRKTESAWIAEARKSTSRELERKVAVIKQRARAARSGADAQGQMPGLTPSSAGSTPTIGTDGPSRSLCAEENVVRPDFEPPVEVPSDLHYRLSPTQLARYEALMEKLRKLGVQGSREELMLECMELAVEVKAANREGKAKEDKARKDKANPAGVTKTPYQVGV